MPVTVYVEDSEMLLALTEEKEALALLGRMDFENMSFSGSLPVEEDKEVVRLVIKDGVVVDIPMKNLVDTDKVSINTTDTHNCRFFFFFLLLRLLLFLFCLLLYLSRSSFPFF